ncbi:MAG: glycosyltransferase [Sphingobium sp.]
MAKIAFVTFGLGLGGTDRVCCHLARGFHEAGDDVTVLACTGKGKGQAILDAVIADGPSFVELAGVAWKNRQVQKAHALIGYVRWLRAERPDFVVATGNNICRFTALGFRLARIRSDSRLIIKITNPVIRPRRKLSERIRRHSLARAFEDAAAVLTLSREEARILACAFPRAAGRFHHVYNPYLTDAFDHASSDIERCERPKSTGNDNKTVMLAVGRLHHQKNFPRMLHAFATLIHAGQSDLLLKIVGDGPDRQQIADLIDKLGLTEHVQMLGYSSDIPKSMAAADVLLLSSDYEGLPAVVIEALACDCPVISTDCFPAAKSLLQGIPHCRVADKDVASLAAAMKTWLDMPRGRPKLREHALRYSTANAVESHRSAMFGARRP